MPADLTGLYRAGPMHVLVVERDGELEAHPMAHGASMPPQLLSAAAVDHHLQSGRWARCDSILIHRGGRWLVSGSFDA